jgi:hypothetical protein
MADSKAPLLQPEERERERERVGDIEARCAMWMSPDDELLAKALVELCDGVSLHDARNKVLEIRAWDSSVNALLVQLRAARAPPSDSKVPQRERDRVNDIDVKARGPLMSPDEELLAKALVELSDGMWLHDARDRVTKAQGENSSVNALLVRLRMRYRVRLAWVMWLLVISGLMLLLRNVLDLDNVTKYGAACGLLAIGTLALTHLIPVLAPLE